MNKLRFVLFLTVMALLIGQASATLQVVASNTVQNSNDTEHTGNSISGYETISGMGNGYSTSLPNILGTFNVTFQVKSPQGTWNYFFAKLFKNGNSFGTEHYFFNEPSSYRTYTEQFSGLLNSTDTLEVRAYTTAGYTPTYVQNFRLMYDYVVLGSEGGVGYNWSANASSSNYTAVDIGTDYLWGGTLWRNSFENGKFNVTGYNQYSTDNPAIDYYVSNGLLIQGNASTNVRHIIFNDTNFSRNIDISSRMKLLGTTGLLAIGVVWDLTAYTNHYRFYSDSATTTLNCFVGGSWLCSNTSTKSLTNNTFYDFRLKVFGNNFSGKIFNYSTAEPSSWNNIATESTIPYGNVGFMARSTIGIDYYWVRPVDNSGNLITTGNYTFKIKDFKINIIPQGVRLNFAQYFLAGEPLSNISIYINTSSNNITWSGSHLLANNVSNYTVYVFNDSDQVRYIQTTLEWSGGSSQSQAALIGLDYIGSLPSSPSNSGDGNSLYSFENNINDSISSYNGTYYGNISFVDGGISGKALSLTNEGATGNLSSRVMLGSIWNNLSNLNINLSFKASGLNTNQHRLLFEHYVDDNNRFFIGVQGSNNKLWVYLNRAGAVYQFLAGNDVGTNWHNISVQVGDNGLYLYDNNSLIGSDSTAIYGFDNLGVSTDNLIGSGKLSGNYDFQFDGLIDNLSISSIPETINILYPYTYTVIQRNISNVGNIFINGTYSGNTTSIEARFNGSSWKVINSSVSSGVFSGNLTNQSIGQGNLEVRFGNNNSITDILTNISVGDLIVLTGQSNPMGHGGINHTQNISNKYIATSFNNNIWRVANDPNIFSTNPYGSVWPLLADNIIQNTSIPIGFIAASIGGTNISSWQKGNSSYQSMSNLIASATNNENKVAALLYSQGEADMRIDADLKGNYTAYYNYLISLSNSIKSDYNIKTIVVQSPSINGSGTWYITNRTTVDNIRKAQSDSWTTSNISEGSITYDFNLSSGLLEDGRTSDGVHITKDSDIHTLAHRLWRTLNATIYNGTSALSPKLINATLTGTNQITIYFNSSNLPLKNGSGGWRIYGIFILDDSNISTTIDSNKVILTLDQNIYSGNISLGSFKDGEGKYVLEDSNGLPALPFTNITINDSYISPITNPQTIIGNFYINNTWIDPTDADFDHVYFAWSNGTSMNMNTSKGTQFMNMTGLTPHYQQNISGQTVDTSGNMNLTKVWFNATIPNNNPIKASIGNKQVTAGQWLNFTVSATDADSDTITYGTNASNGTLNTTTGNFNWSTTGADVGTYHWNFNSSDGYSGIAQENITVTVNSAEPASFTHTIFGAWE